MTKKRGRTKEREREKLSDSQPQRQGERKKGRRREVAMHSYLESPTACWPLIECFTASHTQSLPC